MGRNHLPSGTRGADARCVVASNSEGLEITPLALRMELKMAKDAVSTAANLAGISKANLVIVLNLLRQMDSKGYSLDDCIRLIQKNM